jgi:hypothetical protein
MAEDHASSESAGLSKMNKTDVVQKEVGSRFSCSCRFMSLSIAVQDHRAMGESGARTAGNKDFQPFR